MIRVMPTLGAFSDSVPVKMLLKGAFKINQKSGGTIFTMGTTFKHRGISTYLL